MVKFKDTNVVRIITHEKGPMDDVQFVSFGLSYGIPMDPALLLVSSRAAM
jgi:RNase adaptor protein for sRNA GlmZ degradation